MSYKIVRFYRDNDEMNGRVIKTGLTLEQAQAHCQDPETSSSTAKGEWAVKHAGVFGPWFDGYTEE